MTDTARCIRWDDARGWHITHEFVERANSADVKRDGPFIIFASGEAYEIIGDCPLTPRTYDCVIRDNKGEEAFRG